MPPLLQTARRIRLGLKGTDSLVPEASSPHFDVHITLCRGSDDEPFEIHQ